VVKNFMGVSRRCIIATIEPSPKCDQVLAETITSPEYDRQRSSGSMSKQGRHLTTAGVFDLCMTWARVLKSISAHFRHAYLILFLGCPDSLSAAKGWQ
jgi:hypothetical protein